MIGKLFHISPVRSCLLWFLNLAFLQSIPRVSKILIPFSCRWFIDESSGCKRDCLYWGETIFEEDALSSSPIFYSYFFELLSEYLLTCKRRRVCDPVKSWVVDRLFLNFGPFDQRSQQSMWASNSPLNKESENPWVWY